MKYRSIQEVDIHSVAELIYNASREWAALPEYLRKRYEEGDVFFSNDYISIKSYPDISGYVGDYLLHSPTSLYFCGKDHIDAHYEKISDDPVDWES